MEYDRHLLSLGVGKRHGVANGMLRTFSASFQVGGAIAGLHFRLPHRQAFSKVAEVGFEAQTRCFNHLYTIIADAVGGHTAIVAECQVKPVARRGHGFGLCHHGDGHE